MPALISPLVGFAFGVLFARAADEELARSTGTPWGTRSLAMVVLFAFLNFGPASGYFLTYATDWSFAYLVDARHLPSALLLLFWLVDIASVPCGFLLAAPRARQRRLSALLPLGVAPLTAALLFVGVFSRRLSLYGSYAQVTRTAGAAPLSGSPTGYAVLWLNFCLVAAAAWTVRELYAPSAPPRRG